MKDALPGHAAFVRHLGQFCAPISWAPSRSSPASSLETNGTCALVDTGITNVLITCHHVWKGFWEGYRKKHHTAELLLGLGPGVPLILTGAQMLDCDKDLDLAVIKADFAQRQLRTKAFYPIQEWPIPRPTVGDAVAIVGFPGSGRHACGGTAMSWSLKFLGLTVSGVSERNITLAPERNDRRNYDENGTEIPHDDLGGMSGSPAFLLREVGPPSLVGFLYEGHNSDRFIFLTPASYLQRDGTLRSSHACGEAAHEDV